MGFTRDNYIHIKGWMITDMNLKGNELLAYAIIYGFTQDGETLYQGSSKYISDALQVSRTTAIKALNGLIEKGLIQKTQEIINNVAFNRYAVSIQAIQNLSRGCTESVQEGYTETVQGGYVETVHSNNKQESSTRNNKEKNKKVYFPEDEKLNEAFLDYIDMRKKIRSPMTDRAITLAIKNLENLTKDMFGLMDNDKAIKILNQSVMNSWKGLFPLKEDKRTNKPSGGIDWNNV